MKQHFSYIAIIMIICAALLGGCATSVSKKGPDLNVIKIGAARSEVEAQFGKPIKSVPMPDGKRQDTYEYELEEGSYRGDAPVEKVEGNKYRCKIVYDQDDKVFSADKGIRR